MSVVVNLLALALIGFIVWWFWLARSRNARPVTASIDVLVEGGVYTPATIEITKGQRVTLNFIRRDASPCAEKVVFAALGISADLPLGQTKEIVLKPDREGEYDFTCQMGMYRGVLVVK